MEFWQVLALLIFSNLLILSAVYSGFYFGWMAKRNSPPAGIPIISNIVDSITNKKEKHEENEAQKSFFS
jgi:hypothetical protein